MLKRTLHTVLFLLAAILAASAQSSSLARYESWINNDYDHRTVTEASGDSITQVIDLEGWAEGIYFYNFRAQNTDGEWGPLYRYLIFVAEPDASAQVAAINYWIDDDTLNIKEQATRGTTVNISMDVSQLEKGTHTFSCFMQNILGDTTDVFHFDFELGYVEQPVLTRQNKSVTMQTSTPGASIYYTLDGSKPTKNGLRYTEPIVPTANGLIKAVAVREGWFNSEVASMTVDWVLDPTDVETVHTALEDLADEDDRLAGLLDNIKEQGNAQTHVEAAQRLRCDTLRAMLDCCRLDVPTQTNTYLNEVEQIELLLTDMDTQRQQMEAERSALQTTLDSLKIVEGQLNSLLEAATTKEEVAQIALRVDTLQHTYTAADARLQQLVERGKAWTTQMATITVQMKTIESGIVDGTVGVVAKYALRADHLAHLGRFPQLRYADLSQCTMENDALPDRVFSGLPRLVWASLPASMISVGSHLFADCPAMAAVVWNGTGIVSDRALAGIDNPNLLLYVGSATQVRDVHVANIVVGGVASHIALTDGDGQENVNFYVPRAFHVSGDISYTHSYDQTTAIGQCQGWETVCLPFDVQTIVHETRGEAVPFAAYEAPKRPFWLCRLTEQGFEDASVIRAGQPYIISMPNSEEYAPYYRLGGKVSFSSRNIDVPATAYVIDQRGASSFVPTFERVAASSEVFALNVGDARDGYAEGSVFISDYVDVLPFQCYRKTTAAGVRYISIADDLDDDTQGISLISETSEGEHYFNLQGIPVKEPGKGIYIVRSKQGKTGKKIIKH